MLILLPPSEGKTPPTRGKPMDPSDLSFRQLWAGRMEVLDALLSLSGAGTQGETARLEAARILGLGRTQVGEVDRNAALLRSPAARADRVYSGVLYESLDLPSVSAAAKRRANHWLVVVSALFGLLRPADRIPAYRLSGDVSLPGVGPVAAHWSRHLGPVLEEAAGEDLVVDLRSSTYLPFWRPSPGAAGRTATVRVLHEVSGERKVVSHGNKATKGRLVRALVEEGGRPTTPAALVEELRDLGWTVESGPSNRLDVVVRQL